MQLNKNATWAMGGKHMGNEWEAELPIHTSNSTSTHTHTHTLRLNFAFAGFGGFLWEHFDVRQTAVPTLYPPTRTYLKDKIVRLDP